MKKGNDRRIGAQGRFLRGTLLLLFALGVAAGPAAQDGTDDRYAERSALTEELLGDAGEESLFLRNALLTVRRHEYIEPDLAPLAYGDLALPLADGSLLPSPGTIVRAILAARPAFGEKVLIAGRGTGYAAALLERLGVYLFQADPGVPERNDPKTRARSDLFLEEWYADAPFDLVWLHASRSEVPASILALVRDGGSLVVSLRGSGSFQTLVIMRRSGDQWNVVSLGEGEFSRWEGGS